MDRGFCTAGVGLRIVGSVENAIVKQRVRIAFRRRCIQSMLLDIGHVSTRSFVGSVTKYSMCVKPIAKSSNEIAGVPFRSCTS